MFNAMLEALKEESVGYLFNLQVQQAEPEQAPAGAVTPGSTGVLADAGGRPAGRAGNGAAAAVAAAAAAAAAASGASVASGDGGGDGHAVPPALRAKGLDAPGSRPLTYSAPAEGGGTEVRGATAKRGGGGGRHAAAEGAKEPARNAPCPCGSGKKYKRCHGAPTGARS
jgi:preprotein translocase subunit SecA